VNPPPGGSQFGRGIPIYRRYRASALVFLITEGIFAVQHKFLVGQTVVLMPRLLQPAVPGAYEVRRLMPESDRDGGDPMYRIKSIDEKHERVVAESELTPSA
jgi:hypothetical protein